MTIYPAEFHRRLEQKWARRAQLSKGSKTMPGPRAFVRPYWIMAAGIERDGLNGVPVSRPLLHPSLGRTRRFPSLQPMHGRSPR